MKTRLLIVDDHGEIRRLIRLTFASDQFEIHEASDGAEALALARRVEPRVVLLDVMMPGPFDGLEVCRQIKNEPSLHGVRVVLLTARGQQHDLDAGIGAGADGYFIKPFSPIELLDRVEQITSTAGAR